MDIKLKKISYSTWVKTTAFLLAIVLFATAYSFLASMLVSSDGAFELLEKDYASSNDCLRQAQSVYGSIERVLAWKSEEYIVNEYKKAEYEQQIADKLSELEEAQTFLSAVSGIYYYVSDGANVFTNCEMTTEAEFKKYELYDIVDGNQNLRTTDSSIQYYDDLYAPYGGKMKIYVAFEDWAANMILDAYRQLATLLSLKNEENIRSNCLAERNVEIQNCIMSFTIEQDNLEKVTGIYYYAADGDTVLTNCNFTTAEEFRKFEYYNIVEGYVTEFGVGSNIDTRLTPGRNIYIAFDGNYMAEKQAEFETTKTRLREDATKALLSFIAGLLALVYLIFVCGRDKDKNINMLTIDRLWTELTLVGLILTLAGFSAIALEVMKNAYNIYREILPFIMVGTALFFAVALMFFLSLIRHIKNRTLIKHSLICIICRKLGGVFKILFSLTPLKFKIVGSIISAALIAFIFTNLGYFSNSSESLVIFMLMTIAITVGIVYVILRFVIKPYDDEVNSRLEISLNKAMKAERLKTELITNVSHDLKTPLTAIINYSTLLLERDKDDEYAGVIHEKSMKLKTLTEDLFEVSKVQSGNIAANMEKLNVAEFIDQMLTEADEHIVDFRSNVEDVSIMADGKLMNRVFENIIGNINKYSMPGSRAYIDAYDKDGMTHIVFKNMANYEMNFNASEMTERFSRGDSSRTTDGNGLGLAIAQSYTEACGGKLQIDIDGDLFKVTLIF